MKNFEKYKATAERVTAHKNWCDRHHESCDRDCGCCGIKWLHLEADVDKPMDCPFCGCECIVTVMREEWRVACTLSGCYRSSFFSSKDKAVAAHNRVCKAVAAYKENN